MSLSVRKKKDRNLLSSKWFLDTSSMSGNEEEILQCLRHKADYEYFTKNYSQASVTYEHCLRLLPASNVSCRRECMENLSRSLLHMGSAEKALEWALKMHAAAVNSDQKIVSLNLLATVCHALEKYEEELEALHSCLEPHKNNPDLWFRLAFCYAGMFKLNMPGCICKLHPLPYCCAFNSRLACRGKCEESIASCIVSSDKCTENTQHSLSQELDESVHCALSRETDMTNQLFTSEADNKEPEPKNISHGSTEKCEMCTLGVQMVSACLLRARLLMNSCEKNHFIAEKYSRMNEKITKCLIHMEVEQSFIDEASKMLKSEIFGALPISKEFPSMT